MYVSKLTLNNLRCFGGRHSVSFGRQGARAGWFVLAGRNGAGKSTVLKALALAVVGPLAARSLSPVFNDWVTHGESQASARLELELDAELDRFQGKGNTPTGKLSVGLKWEATARASDSVSRQTRGKHEDRGPWADAPRGWFVAGYGPYRHLGPAPAEVVRMSVEPTLARLVNLFHEGATLSDAIEWLQQLHTRALEQRAGAAELRDDVLAFLGAGLLPDGSEVVRVDSEGLWLRRDRRLVVLEQVSDGYRTVAALVVDLLRRLHDTYGELRLRRDADEMPQCPLPGVVLIDEVDAHMHVAWQQRIGSWLTRRFPAVQFIVTSHSPFICQSASKGGLVRLPAPDEDRTMEVVDDAVWSAVVHGGVDKAVLTELFGLEHPHGPDTERKRRRLSDLEAKVLRGDATEEQVASYRRLREELDEDIGAMADRKLRAIGS